jgi:cation transport protein ChaC
VNPTTFAGRTETTEVAAPLTREALRDGWLQRLVAAANVRVLSEDELRASRAAVLACHPDNADVWLFAYGSLIWNPAFRFVERRVGQVHGLHRRFCLWTALGRGSPDQPGLVLGLDRGGRCRGVLYRIAAADVEAELDVVWRREMVTGAYRPRWVRALGAAGSVNALTFVIERRHERYAGNLGEEQLVRTLATARGALGSCADYLFATTAHLEQLDIADAALQRLCAAVRAHQRHRRVAADV